ncbi:site-2 protease family protein [Candidatus Peregrinibacteria bacterium]|nr:site-2 protease family protein [Candidatus Peregrinibacteria bacterium]
MIIVAILAFIIIFSILVLVHEWGHFTMARRAGIKVEEFGIGMPPRAKTLFKDKKGTVYSLNWVPFGGFVRLFGEDSVDPKILKDKKSFASKSIAQRTSVIVAGVFMNFVLAWVLITIGFMVGMKPFLVTQEDVQRGIESGIVEAQTILYVHEVEEGMPLSATGLRAGDYILSVNGVEVTENMDLSQVIKPNALATILYIRNSLEKTLEVRADEAGKVGMTISTENYVREVKEVRYPFYQAPVKAVQEIGRLSVLTVKMIGTVVVSVVARFKVPEGVAGPVGIAKLTHTFTQQGFMALVQFTALLSISLGVINIMPFPALDGGRFLFIIFEVITRRRANAKMEAVVHTVGFALLMLLILFITWNDIVNLFQ